MFPYSARYKEERQSAIHHLQAESQLYKTSAGVVEAALTLSFDHRVLDGGAAGRLLTRIADLITHPEKL